VRKGAVEARRERVKKKGDSPYLKRVQDQRKKVTKERGETF
jgi:hypothetical protein